MRVTNALLCVVVALQFATLDVQAGRVPAAQAPLEVVVTEDRSLRTLKEAGDYSSIPVVQCATLPQQQAYLAQMIVEGIREALERELRILAARLTLTE